MSKGFANPLMLLIFCVCVKLSQADSTVLSVLYKNQDLNQYKLKSLMIETACNLIWFKK